MAKSAQSASSSRDAILSAIRRGLDAGALPKPFPEVESVSHAEVFNPLPHAPEESFAEAFIALGGKFIYCASELEMFDALHALIDDRGWEQTLCADDALLNRLHRGGLNFIKPAREGAEDSDACITGCEALVARTGSVILSSALPGGRVAPVYYPVHIIVARAGQVVADLGPGLSLFAESSALPSLINLNTGPSRTADIEKTLVVGVHGPKEVFCFFLDR